MPFKSLLIIASSDDATRAARCRAAAMVVSGMQGLDCTTSCHLFEIDERQERIVIRAEAARKPPSRDETKKTAHEDMIERGMRAERTTPGGDICTARRGWKCPEHELDGRVLGPQ